MKPEPPVARVQDPACSILAPRLLRPDAQQRLFCFSYAGGSASVFARWCGLLPATIDVCPVELPGHGHRMLEPPLPSIEEIADHLYKHLHRMFDRPFAFFGYSMGALVAFELCHILHDAAKELPMQLFVAASRAPGRAPMRRRLHMLPDSEFVSALLGFNDRSRQALEDEELREIILPVLRTDFMAIETYEAKSRPSLPLPIVSFAGSHDNITPPAAMTDWGRHTLSGFMLRIIEGDHFFLNTAGRKIAEQIGRDLSTAVNNGKG